MNVFEYLFERSIGNRIALVHDGGSTTYAELFDSASALGNSLTASGLEPGDHVAILANNSLFWIKSYLGILYAGGVAVPLPPIIHAEQLPSLLRWLGCRFLLVQPERIASGTVVSGAPVVLVADSSYPGGLRRIETTEDPPLNADDAAVAAGQIAALMLTSGSAVAPRAVMVSHHNIVANTESIIEALHLESDHRMLCAMPFAYCFSTSLLHTHFRVGASLALYSGVFAPGKALEAIDAYSCTSLAGIPSVFQVLLTNHSFSAHPTPSLRCVQQAGGRLAPAFIQALHEILPEARIHVMYGQTEATARLTALPPERLTSKIDSVGLPIPGVEIAIVGDDGAACSPRQVGMITAAGHNVALGYWRDPASSAARFRDGRLHTGDVGFCDEDGFLYIVDREEDFIKAAGHRFSARVVEECIAALPGVVEVAVVGVPHRTLGEAAKAYIVLKPGSSLTKTLVVRNCRDSLPHYMAPRQVAIVGELPRNAKGQVMKSTLRRLG